MRSAETFPKAWHGLPDRPPGRRGVVPPLEGNELGVDEGLDADGQAIDSNGSKTGDLCRVEVVRDSPRR